MRVLATILVKYQEIMITKALGRKTRNYYLTNASHLFWWKTNCVMLCRIICDYLLKVCQSVHNRCILKK